MGQTVSDFLVSRLNEWGITRLYGYPGDGINGIMGALDRSDGSLSFIQARHEEMAAFMACAHAKFTGEVGVCLATSGPGAIHLLNGLYDARVDHQPVVAIVGQQALMSIGSDYQQEVDLLSLFKDVAGEYVQMVSTPLQTRQLVDRAVRIAKAGRTVTCLIFPNDVQSMPYEDPGREHGAVYTGTGYSRPRIIPAEEDLKRAADVLNEGRKVAILIGAGALDAGPEVARVAEILGAGVSKALLGKAALDDSLPYVTGSIGLLGTKPTWDMMMNCDTLFMVGSGFPYAEFLPKEGQARGVQIDISPRMLSLRYPMEVNLHGDSRETLLQLIPLLQRKEDRRWQQNLEKSTAEWWETMEARAMEDADPINPQRVFHELSPLLPNDVVLCGDSGTVVVWYARHLKLRTGMMASLSGNLASMGSAVPYAIAAKFAHPGRPVVALAGDGAMQMNGLSELITIQKYWKQWKDPRIVVLVLNNRDLNMVTWEQRVMQGNPKFDASQNLPDFPYAAYAEMLGLQGLKVDRPEDVAPAWESALRADRPVVLDVHTDPDVPPLPPHVKPAQAMSMMKAILKGDPNAADVIRQSYKDWGAGFSKL